VPADRVDFMEIQGAEPSWTNWLQTVAVVVASLTAIWGILQWRIQIIAERKMSLAEEVLSAFYEAQDIIAAARNPFTPAGEGRSWRPGEELEHKEMELFRVDAYFAPTERLNSNTDFFASFGPYNTDSLQFSAFKQRNISTQSGMHVMRF
jgi:hypothetical protein